MPRFTPGHIEHPTAYANAIAARIKMNKRHTNAKAFRAAIADDSAEFKFWLGLESSDIFMTADELAAEHVRRARWAAVEAWPTTTMTPAERQAQLDAARVARRAAIDCGDDVATDAFHALANRRVDAFYRTHRRCPDFLRDALRDWGGLTEKQLAFARKAWAEQFDRAAATAAREATRRANAAPWVAGRQRFEAIVVMAKGHSTSIGYGRTTYCTKALMTLEDGRKAWLTLPQAATDGLDYAQMKGMAVDVTATMTPSDDDATMAFGKRPTLHHFVVAGHAAPSQSSED